MTPTPEEVLARACSVTRYEGHETYEHRNCRWCGAGGYVNHPKIKTDFEHRPDCPIVALAASQEQLQLLRDAVNDSSGECSPACSSEGHADDCEYVDMAATLVIQQRKLAASEEQLHALQLSHRIRGENIEMLERELMLFREATLR